MQALTKTQAQVLTSTINSLVVAYDMRALPHTQKDRDFWEHKIKVSEKALEQMGIGIDVAGSFSSYSNRVKDDILNNEDRAREAVRNMEESTS